MDLVDSGRTPPEIVEGIESYYHKLAVTYDEEYLSLREELEV